MENENLSRMIRVVWINPYLNNMAYFNWYVYSTSLIFVWTSILGFMLFSIYFYESFDYLKALSEVESDFLVLIKYIGSYTMGVLNNFNHLNDLLGAKVFNFNIPLYSPNLPTIAWVFIISSGILSFLFHILPLYQFYTTKIIKTSGFFNYYIPYAFLHKFWFRKKSKKVYIRLLPLVRLEKITKTDYLMLMQNFFNIKVEDIKNYELKVEAKSWLWWFDYQILHLVEINSKKKEYKIDEEKNISKDKSHREQSRKISSNNEKLKGFFE